MKNLLITGNVLSLAAHLCQRLSRQYHAVIAAHEVPPIAFGKGVDVVPLTNDQTLEQVCQQYAFSSMVFLATRGEQQSRLHGEADLLSSALALAKRHGMYRVLYITSGELCRPADASSERGVLMQAMEQLCTCYRKQGLDITIVRLPCVFGPGESDTLSGRMLTAAALGETITLPFARGAQLDFVSAAEVAQLAYMLLEREEEAEDVLMVRGAEALSVRELTALFGLLGASVSQGVGGTGYPPMDASAALDGYGFAASERFSVALDSLYMSVKSSLKSKEPVRGRIRTFLKRYSYVIKGTSLVLGFAAMELLKMLQSAGHLPLTDLHLLYVALISAAHGLQAGLVAVVLACFSIARGYGAQNMDLLSLFTDWKAWVPFVVLLATGSLVGYARDKGRREALSAKEEADLLEKRCAFLQDLYKQSLLAADEEPALKTENTSERLEQQLTQLRQGQERLEQEWMTLLKKEQERWEKQNQAQVKREADAQEIKRTMEAARMEKEREEMKAAQEQLAQLRLKNIQTERGLADLMLQTSRTVDAKFAEKAEEPKQYRSAQIKPPIILSTSADYDAKDDIDFDELPTQLKIDSLPDDDEDDDDDDDDEEAVEEEKVKPAPVAVKMADLLETSEQKDKVELISTSPFGKLTPQERRRMLEAMQERAKEMGKDKPKRSR